jgi:hypothetical protein
MKSNSEELTHEKWHPTTLFERELIELKALSFPLNRKF